MELRYVILHHTGIDTPHFDLMFETAPGSALATWRSLTWPIKGVVMLEKLADHRREYLVYEGTVSGGRGDVKRMEQGACQVASGPDRWEIELLPGRSRLVFTKVNDHWQAKSIA